MSRPNAFVGSPIERVEDARLLRGRGVYVGDLADEDLLHAVVLRSQIAHGRLRGCHVAAARELAGVRAVITARDIGPAIPVIPIRQHAAPGGEQFRQPVLAHDKVRYVGEPVAVVVAEHPAIAEDALELIELEIDELPPLPDHLTAAADDALLFEHAGTNRAALFQAYRGDAEQAFRTAEYCRRERFSVQRHTALPMEPRGLVADWQPDAGRLTLYGAAKVPFFNRRTLAGMLSLPEDCVDLIELDVGGGFGARGEFYPEDFLIPFAARQVGGRVCWVEDRREHLMAMNHAREMYADLEIACARDGRVLGLRGTVNVDLGAYARTNGFTAAYNVIEFLSGPYHIQNVALEAAVYVTSKTPTGTYRGPGRFEASYFCERLFDMAAADLGIDPVVFHRKNLLREEQMPYPLPHVSGLAESWDTEFDSGAYEVVLDRCLEEFKWADKRQHHGKFIGGRYHGVALGCFIEGGAGGRFETAKLSIERDGSVCVAVGSSAIGQGLATVLTQIAADALELPMQRIRLLHGSTHLVTRGFGSFHSRSTVMGGSAILLASQDLLEQLRHAAAERVGCSSAEVRVSDGVVVCPSAVFEFSDFAGLFVERTFRNDKHTYSYGTHAAHVAVDAATGEVEVLEYVTVEDVGRIINPLTLHGQVIGSVVQGLGSVFLEHIRYDERGQILTGSLADYLLPTATDFPRIRGISLELRPSPNNPLGAKGAGEGGLIAVGGVICNAVAGALRGLGVEPRDLPLSPPRLWALIRDAQQCGSPHREAAR